MRAFVSTVAVLLLVSGAALLGYARWTGPLADADAALADYEGTLVLYESPRRLLATLEAIEAVFGEAEVVLAREVTKQFEEFRRGPAGLLRAAIAADGVRGEVTVIVNPRGPVGACSPDEAGDERAPAAAEATAWPVSERRP